MMKKFVNILISCIFVTVIAGCASSSPTRFYTLSSTFSAGGDAAGELFRFGRSRLGAGRR